MQISPASLASLHLMFTSRFMLCLVLLLPAPAHAVTVSIITETSSSETGVLAIGDTVTLDMRVENQLDNLYGAGISVQGYDAGVVEFLAGDVATRFFNVALLPDGTPIGGFTNYATTRSGHPLGSTATSEKIGPNGLPYVELFQGVSLSPIQGDGSLDPGLDGSLVGAGDVHARVTFRLIGAGSTTLHIGTGNPWDVLVLTGGESADATGASIELFSGRVVANPLVVLPEPGTAVLLGLGMGLLARRRPVRT